VGSEKSGGPRKYEVGHRFGEWTLLERLGYQGGTHSRWKVKCSCGVVNEVASTNLTSGKSTRCGSCAAKKRNEERKSK
jgi:hypothetical protein